MPPQRTPSPTACHLNSIDIRSSGQHPVPSFKIARDLWPALKTLLSTGHVDSRFQAVKRIHLSPATQSSPPISTFASPPHPTGVSTHLPLLDRLFTTSRPHLTPLLARLAARNLHHVAHSLFPLASQLPHHRQLSNPHISPPPHRHPSTVAITLPCPDGGGRNQTSVEVCPA